ncbi:hypothetical protein, partial [uncultured Anaerotruncus sp.]|uniref:hypothetical protein n=1 Tax=uncultured Anaerotruncus sp. TaxID=905011 RepID=UPI00321F8153
PLAGLKKHMESFAGASTMPWRKTYSIPWVSKSRVRFFAGSDLGIFCDLRFEAIPLLIFQELGGITVGAFQPAQ